MTPDEIEADYLAQRQRLPFLDEREMVEGFAATFARSLAERRERKASIALREQVRMDRWPRALTAPADSSTARR